MSRRTSLVLTMVLAAGALTACGGGGGAAQDSGATAGTTTTRFSAAAMLGEKIFVDTSLSASGRQACASCHVPQAAHGADNARPVQPGGSTLELEGQRSSPSLRYLAFTPPFQIGAEGRPSGGFFWDGRAATLQQQAGEPLLGRTEMANESAAALAARLARTAYAAEFKALYGADILQRPDDLFARITLALAQYQREDPEFRPFSSKFDAVLRGEASLAPQESRGLALFNRADKGNCAACHPSGRRADGGPPLFTDFSYDNIGVPRNAVLVANADPARFDLGLCDRSDLAARTDLCGAFRVPTLRNVAQRRSFFHNGRFATLKEALSSFYVQRDTNPERWYPRRADGSVERYDDTPAAWRANVNTREAPFNRQPGDAPALSDAEIDELIAFLHTLSDGWRPAAP